MSSREIDLSEWLGIERPKPCPRCGNRERFIVHSIQVCEDLCHVWAECVCGHDPTQASTSHRLESVMGGCGIDNVRAAIAIWNERNLVKPAPARA